MIGQYPTARLDTMLLLVLAIGGSSGVAAEPIGGAGTRAEREWLAERGIVLGFAAKTELLTKARGGASVAPATRYRGLLDFNLTLDTERLGLWRGGTVFFSAQNGHGEGLTLRHVGDIQVLSNIDAHRFTQLSELWLRQELFDGRVRLKLGRQDANADFGCLDTAGDFLNASFGLIPTAPIPSFPLPAPGAAAAVDLTRELTLGLGVFDPNVFGAPDVLRGASVSLELRFDPTSQSHYRAGFWRVHPAPGVAPEATDGAGTLWTFHAAAEGRLIGPGHGRGLRGFAQLGIAPTSVSGITGYLGLGGLYQGPLPGRAQDRLGLAMAHARLGAVPGGVARSETSFELFYRARVLPWLSLQPDLQYIVTPGGRHADALVVGMRVEAVF